MIAGKEERIVIFLVYNLHPLTNIYLVHWNFWNLFLSQTNCNFQTEIGILFVFRLMKLSRSYWLWHFKVTFQSDIVRIWAHIKLSPFYYKTNALTNWLRFTPLATTVYISHVLNRTTSHHLSSIRLPKCIRNEGCFIFLQEFGRRISKSIFRVLK